MVDRSPMSTRGSLDHELASLSWEQVARKVSLLAAGGHIEFEESFSASKAEQSFSGPAYASKLLVFQRGIAEQLSNLDVEVPKLDRSARSIKHRFGHGIGANEEVRELRGERLVAGVLIAFARHRYSYRASRSAPDTKKFELGTQPREAASSRRAN